MHRLCGSFLNWLWFMMNMTCVKTPTTWTRGDWSRLYIYFVVESLSCRFNVKGVDENFESVVGLADHPIWGIPRLTAFMWTFFFRPSTCPSPGTFLFSNLSPKLFDSFFTHYRLAGPPPGWPAVRLQEVSRLKFGNVVSRQHGCSALHWQNVQEREKLGCLGISFGVCSWRRLIRFLLLLPDLSLFHDKTESGLCYQMTFDHERGHLWFLVRLQFLVLNKSLSRIKIDIVGTFDGSLSNTHHQRSSISQSSIYVNWSTILVSTRGK